MVSHQPREFMVLTKHYSKLCCTLSDIHNLLPHFVQENVISINEVEVINATIPSTMKVQKLIAHISGPLEAGNTKVFYIMLRIMEERGHQATRELANQIKRSLPIAVDDKRSDYHSK